MARLEDARLIGAHLEEADLSGAHLERAELSGANLTETHLYKTHLEGAYLLGAKGLHWAYIGQAHVDDETLLPDDLRLALARRRSS